MWLFSFFSLWQEETGGERRDKTLSSPFILSLEVSLFFEDTKELLYRLAKSIPLSRGIYMQQLVDDNFLMFSLSNHHK